MGTRFVVDSVSTLRSKVFPGHRSPIEVDAKNGGDPVPTVHVRYMVNDVEAAIAFYTAHLGFTLISKTLPAFADVFRGDLRLLLSGPASSAGRAMPDGRRPTPGGWNRIHLIVEDLAAEVQRLRAAGVRFRNEIVTGPGGSQILLDDPSGNPVELFQPRRP
jgi:catechol 2,3-dioxygenase-like lactoylglutathione lyase family enzyme